MPAINPPIVEKKKKKALFLYRFIRKCRLLIIAVSLLKIVRIANRESVITNHTDDGNIRYIKLDSNPSCTPIIIPTDQMSIAL